MKGRERDFKRRQVRGKLSTSRTREKGAVIRLGGGKGEKYKANLHTLNQFNLVREEKASSWWMDVPQLIKGPYQENVELPKYAQGKKGTWYSGNWKNFNILWH